MLEPFSHPPKGVLLIVFPRIFSLIGFTVLIMVH